VLDHCEEEGQCQKRQRTSHGTADRFVKGVQASATREYNADSASRAIRKSKPGLANGLTCFCLDFGRARDEDSGCSRRVSILRTLPVVLLSWGGFGAVYLRDQNLVPNLSWSHTNGRYRGSQPSSEGIYSACCLELCWEAVICCQAAGL
jgi:hypothetical protein